MAVEVADQDPAIGVAAGRVAEGVEFERGLVEHAERRQDVGADGDHLDVGERLGHAEDLDVELVELA